MVNKSKQEWLKLDRESWRIFTEYMAILIGVLGILAVLIWY